MDQFDHTTITHLFETPRCKIADAYLQAGWILLSTATARDEYEFTVFTLGWNKPGDPPRPNAHPSMI